MKKDKTLLPPVRIISKSQKAVVYRNMNRPFVDKMFKKLEEKILLPNGNFKYILNKKERIAMDIKARNTWRTIIEESNKM